MPPPRILPRRALKHRQFPHLSRRIVADDVDVAVIALDFEIAMLRRQPAIEDVDDLDPPLLDEDDPWRFFAAVTRMTFDAERHLTIMKHGLLILLLAVPEMAWGQSIGSTEDTVRQGGRDFLRAAGALARARSGMV